MVQLIINLVASYVPSKAPLIDVSAQAHQLVSFIRASFRIFVERLDAPWNVLEHPDNPYP